MPRKRKTYDREYKLMAVDLSRKRTDLNALAKELGVRAELLYRWRREFLTKNDKSFPGKGKVILSEQEAEIARLKKQLKDSELENAILKKAVGIFSKSDGKYSDS